MPRSGGLNAKMRSSKKGGWESLNKRGMRKGWRERARWDGARCDAMRVGGGRRTYGFNFADGAHLGAANGDGEETKEHSLEATPDGEHGGGERSGGGIGRAERGNQAVLTRS